MRNSSLKKKILILGANPETVPLIKTAKEMGLITYVTDNNPNAHAKKFADIQVNIDGLDVESLCKFVLAEKIDGIMVGVADRLVKPYVFLCEKLGFHCYGNSNSIHFLTNKVEFNRLLEKFNLKTIPKYTHLAAINLPLNNFPLLVKPADGNSGQGFTVCESSEFLQDAINHALTYSKSGQVLIEKYMDCDDFFLYFTFINGRCLLSATADRITIKTQGYGSPVCQAASYPSKYMGVYLQEYHENLVSLFNDLSIQNGVLCLSAFIQNDEMYFYDPGFRLQGEGPNLHLEKILGVDHKKMLINFAMGDGMGELELINLDPTFTKKCALTLWFLLNEGKIHSIIGMEKFEQDPIIHTIGQRLTVGDSVTSKMLGTEGQVFARFYLAADSKSEINSKVNQLINNIKVFDENGNNLIIDFESNIYKIYA
jgi:biotin carboxylase